MKRDEKFELINELSMAVTEQTVYDKVLNKGRVEYLANTNTLKITSRIYFLKAAAVAAAGSMPECSAICPKRGQVTIPMR